MPHTAAIIDELREVFGADGINAVIRAGIRGEPGFYARENGLEIGVRWQPEAAYWHDGNRIVRL
jgi:hypothetical protein